MEGSRFDRLAKQVARDGLSRRTLLRGLAGAVLGGGLERAAPVGAFICRQGGDLCGLDAQCCSGSCVNDHCTCDDGQLLCRDHCIPPCTALDACHVSGVCDPDSGLCTNPVLADNTGCGAGAVCCAGVCTDITTPTTCGQCGHDCTTSVPPNTVPQCSAGSCTYPCDTANGAFACADACCAAGQTCAEVGPGGSLICTGPTTTTTTSTTTAQPTTTTTAAPTTTTTTTTSTTTSTTTTPVCLPTGATCTPASQCCRGSCCSNICVDVQTDLNNCGACGSSCPIYLTNCCNGDCANILRDSDNCGACGTVCPRATPTCFIGACICTDNSSCASLGLNFHCCNGACVDTSTDATNCGACGTSCPSAMPICSNGQCVCTDRSSCPRGLLCCNGTCVDWFTDPANCGECGYRCLVGETCQAGNCDCNRIPTYSVGPGETSTGRSCCPADRTFYCLSNDLYFVPPSCLAVVDCPSGTTPCIGTSCRACCPAGSTCSNGACLQ